MAHFCKSCRELTSEERAAFERSSKSFHENPIKWIKEHVSRKPSQAIEPTKHATAAENGYTFTRYVSDVWKNSSNRILFARIGGIALGSALTTHGVVQFLYAKPNKETGEIDEKPKGPAVAELMAGVAAIGAALIAGKTR